MPDPSVQEILDRFEYHAPTEAQIELLKTARQQFKAIAEFLVTAVPNSRDRALALTALEDTSMKVNKAIIFSEVS